MKLSKLILLNIAKSMWETPYLIVWWIIQIVSIILFFRFDNGTGNLCDFFIDSVDSQSFAGIVSICLGYLMELSILIAIAYWPISKAHEQIGYVQNDKKGILVKLSLIIVFIILSILWSGAVWFLGFISLFFTWMAVMACEAVIGLIVVILLAPFEIF